MRAVGDEVPRTGPSWADWGRSLSRGQRVLLAGVVVAYVLGAGFAGWRLVAPERSEVPPPTAPAMLITEVAELFDVEVGGGSGLRSPTRSYERVDVGEEGQLLLEAWFVGQDLPTTVPGGGRPPLTREERHERDLAFARGEEAFEQWRRERGLDEPRTPLERGTVYADIEVRCVRLLLSGNDVPEPDPDALAELVGLLEQRVGWSLDDPARGDQCERAWWYEDE